MITEVWEKYNDELYTFICSKVSNKETAKDLLQDIFIKVQKGLHKIEDNQKLKSWLYQITRNTITDHYRKRKTNIERYNFDESDAENEGNMNHELDKCIIGFIKALPDKYRHVMEKVYLEQMPQKEYANLHNLSYTAVKSRVQRARKQLKEQLLECCNVKYDTYGNIISAHDNNCKCV